MTAATKHQRSSEKKWATYGILGILGILIIGWLLVGEPIIIARAIAAVDPPKTLSMPELMLTQ